MSLRIVITTTLNDNLFHAKLVPLLRSRPDLEVVVVTDRQGPSEERLKWVWPRGIWRLFGRLGGRLPLLLREIFHPRTRLVMAYNVIPHGLFASTLGHLRGVPVYLHFIGGASEIHFAHNPAISHNRIISRSRNPQRIERMANKVARRAEKIFIPGSQTDAFLRKQGFPPERIVHLHSAVDPDIFFMGEESRDIDVLVVAQINPNKRPVFTLEILEEIKKRRPNARFCWLGDGPLHTEFDAALDRMNLRSSLLWETTGEVAPYYRRSRVYLLCSLSEGLSLSCMESMACGVVPVSSQTGDMGDVVDNERLLPSTATPADYADAIMPLLTDDTLWQQNSRIAAEFIAKKHSFAAATEAWRDILESLSPTP